MTDESNSAIDLTALERDLLGKLCSWKDTRTAYLATDLARDVGVSLPRATAALRAMRVRGLVRHFSGAGGRAGKWQASAHGRRELNR